MRARDTAADRIDPILRGAEVDDLPRLWALDRICFEPGIAYSRREIRRFLALPGALGIIAEIGGRLAGFSLGYPDGDAARVVTLDVHPDFRRRRLGRRLLGDLLGRFAAAGCVRSLLEVDVRNSGAIAFYRREGFQEIGRIPSYYGRGLDAFEMEKVLS
jgi:[ribosomal protein S18]-alanine N-acetyltransferase